MARLAVGAAGALAVVLLAVVTVLLAPETLPRLSETPGQYAGRLLDRGAHAAESLYLRALLLLPGTLSATVASHGGAAKAAEEEKRPISQDTLKQQVAKDENEINAQQEVSTKRYVDAMKEAASADEPLLVVPRQPDDVRSRMPPVDPAGPEMRCGQALGPESSLTTRNVELRAKAIFQGQGGGQYGWKYIITFVNHGSDTVQMLTRHWVFVDGKGRLENEVKGPGARGVTPVLPPGAEWSYESGTSLHTSYGSMHGSFQFEILKGKPMPDGLRSFSARVGRVLLTSKKESSREVPCADAASERLLPTTSVLSIERVILGGRSQAVGQKTVKKDGKKKQKYAFQYDVQFNNARDAPVEIVAHSWEVVDAHGTRGAVAEGSGVGGSLGKRSRTLAAGDAFRVQGELLSETPEANAQGTYKVIVKGEDKTFKEIEARTDWMGLSANPSQTHVPNFVADPSFA